MALTILFIILGSLTVLLLLGNLLTYVWQDGYIFKATPLRSTHEFVFTEPFEETSIPGAKGGTLSGLMFRTQHAKSKGLVIYFPGNTSNLERWGSENTMFTRAGYDFFVFDYYGFGKSKGPVSEEVFYENARLVYDRFAQQYDPSSIILAGKHIGGIIAARLATEVECRHVLLETPFLSVRKLFYSYFPWLPPLFLFKYQFPLYKFIQQVPCPVTIVHGSKDTIVPFQASESLTTYLKHSDQYVVVHGGRNNNLHTFSEYHDALDKILFPGQTQA